MPAEAAAASGAGVAPFAFKQRRLLTKRGLWLGGVVRRWCQVEKDELVYYSGQDSKAPKGRIRLAECTLCRDSTDQTETWPRDQQPGKTLKLERPGKSACVIHGGSSEEMANLAAFLQRQSAKKRVETLQPRAAVARPQPVSSAETTATSAGAAAPSGAEPQRQDLPPLPSSPSMPVGPPSTQIHSLRMGDSKDLPERAAAALAEMSIDSNLGTTELAEVAMRNLSRVTNSSEWSAQVPEELAQGGDVEDIQNKDIPASAGSGNGSSGGGSSSSSGSNSRARQTQAAAFAKVVDTLGPKLAYRKAMELMWNFDHEAARTLLNPWKNTSMWHAGAIAECSVLQVVLTGRKSEALAALELIRAAEAVRDSAGGRSVAHEVFAAEMLLMRSGLQVMLGTRLRALYNLRQCWVTYQKLEQLLSDDLELRQCVCSEDITFSYEDLRGRILFGLGLFYTAASLVPSSLVPLIRLAGFVMHRQRGKAYLFECLEQDLGPRCSMAAILLAMYHLDLEPDMRHAGNILVASLGRQPENALLHWAGSLLAWRNTFITQAMGLTGKALWCCGQELGDKAVYLRYELGMFHFIAMDWKAAHDHFFCVYQSVHNEKVFFPYRTLVTTQLAAVAFSMGEHDRGEILCKECGAVQDWSGLLKLENDFAKVMQIYLKKRKRGRHMLAFEVMYLLRQFPKVPASMLTSLKNQVERLKQPFKEETRYTTSRRPQSEAEEEAVVELASALTIQVVICFYLGDAEAAERLVPQLSHVAPRLPPWASYISAHGLYWCGRVFALRERDKDAQLCLQQAKAYKKYPFNIGVKISKVLTDHEEMMRNKHC